MTIYQLNEQEIEKLMKPIKGDGGFQGLMKKLQGNFNHDTKKIELSEAEIDRIFKYVSYSEGGYESRLVDIFGNHIPDLDAEDFEVEEEDTKILTDLSGFPLDSMLIRTNMRTVNETINRIEQGRFILDPDFQREFVWDIKQQSKLIESCILRIPLPVFYVADREDDGKTIVVDGLQRLTTFKRFVDGEFKLTGLDGNSELLGKKFEDLSVRYQERILDTNLTMYILDSKAPPRAKMEIFERVNSGTKLSRQQMRNALYCGEATRWLKLVSEENDFIDVTQGSLNRKTMRDREAINRFVSFYLIGFEHYPHGDMDGFLANGLEYLSNLPEVEREKLHGLFCMSMKLNFELFERHAFRKSIVSQEDKRTLINISLFDVLSVSFAKLLDEIGVYEHSDFRHLKNLKQLKQIVVDLLNDEEFIDSISKGTNGKKAVEERYNMVFAKISNYHEENYV